MNDLRDVSSQRNPVILARYIELGIVLLAEYLLISFCFDAQPVIARGGTWVAFSKMGTAGLVTVLIGLAAVLLRFISKASDGLVDPMSAFAFYRSTRFATHSFLA